MDRFRLILPPALLATLVAFALNSARAECNPGTLMQWSYGSADGGPKLDEPLVTDRPDFTESSVTVGRGVVQLEMGYTYTFDADNLTSSKQHSYPELLVRIGMLADWFELRLDQNIGGETDTVFGGPVDSATGAEDLGIGCKIALTPQKCILPETAIILEMSVPTGDDDFTADDVLPGFSYCYGWTINDQWETGALTGLHRQVDDDTNDPYVEFEQSWTLVRSWTDNISSYTEWYCFVPCSADTNHTQQYFDGGFSVLLSDDVQWDIRAGVGLNQAADDYFVGSGLSVRFK
jgi:Putative MetA-pathway of phenol degradation